MRITDHDLPGANNIDLAKLVLHHTHTTSVIIIINQEVGDVVAQDLYEGEVDDSVGDVGEEILAESSDDAGDCVSLAGASLTIGEAGGHASLEDALHQGLGGVLVD